MQVLLMKGLQKAARHGNYATQFWTRPDHPPYRTRRAMLTAHSRKAIKRRLVLPLDAHDWGRALEVLDAGYARLGRTAEDYQRVIRGVANETAPQRRGDALHTLNALRDKAYMGEIGSSGLWVTLVWAYARLRYPREGYECLLQGERRFCFSPLTKQHLGETLLPLLAEHGMLDEVKYVVENFMGTGGSRHDRARVASILAEAAARSGSWEHAIAALHPETTTAMTTLNPHTLAFLFVSEELSEGQEEAPETPRRARQISKEALRCMMCSMADDGQWEMALQSLRELERRQGNNDERDNTHDAAGSIKRGQKQQKQQQELSLSENELQRLLNSLGSRQRWEEATALFVSQYFPDKPVRGNEKVRPLQLATLNLLFASFPRSMREFRLAAPDDRLESHGSHTDPRQQENETVTVEIDALHHPQQAVSLFDQIFSQRDDVSVTDLMMVTVGPSLVQLGQWDRALHLLRQTPALSAAKTPVCTLEVHREVRRRLVALLYYLHGAISLESRYYTLYYFPFAFPKETFQDLPPPSEFLAHLRQQREEVEKTSITPSSVPKVSTRRRFTSRRLSAIVQNTEKHDDELRRRLLPLYANRANAFRGGDAEKDPRPIPKGLHDTANGWNFYGRGGEMVFMNHRRTAHPFSMHPKLMRSITDPYRGWNPMQNSCWAHRERVRKWNGSSAV
ncbi:hypothetical protein C3747_22g332 [Trypanosoma cruzi]|uniref:Uncharacterized protein n=2 Tax=Trypanosoma cruzi TaxID=5693 RepID=Q4D9J3_TRYCC|nr:hypothetical protein, conserved [Trypanosoma cruzi]EAN89196.1 hypothetical protein, conserved [Trypanosoma cruzi]PWV16588.1 hypothetical protein C3747_22g332 [Trypanosoma cruzi]RNC57729.1 hypothetical protein TcCL_ESM04688 [Trypanosoma cruzi]|eukprot:XP_811047.1 hypothetical protein [Trypanosoma cruzi strain CL Brener]